MPCNNSATIPARLRISNCKRSIWMPRPAPLRRMAKSRQNRSRRPGPAACPTPPQRMANTRRNRKPAWTPPKTAKLPWLAVTLPGDDASPLWSAPLEIQDLPRLVDSPARRQIVKRLLGGESAVFLLLESGRKEEDAKIAKLLTTTIAKMQKDLALPADDGTGRPQSDLPLRIAFSVLAVRRDDPAEALLVKIVESALEQSNPKKRKEASGRSSARSSAGDASWARSPGKDLTAETIEAACQFLCGACACTLKGELAGTDLLLTADWDALLENRVVRDDPPALRSLGALAEAARAAAVAPAAAGPIAQAASAPRRAARPARPRLPPARCRRCSAWLLATLAAVIGVVLIAAGLMWIDHAADEGPLQLNRCLPGD